MEERNDAFFMCEALKEAQISLGMLEVPVGAVIVRNGEIIARGHNTRETEKNALCHAEIKAIDEACRALGGWRLFDCDLYVTLEPCPMCTGAAVNARIRRIIFGACDEKAGALGSRTNLLSCGLNHTPQVTPGVLSGECSALLSDFFRRLRETEKPKWKKPSV